MPTGNAQAQPGRVGSTQLPSEASMVLRQDSVQGSHGFVPLYVPRESCLVLFSPGFYQQPPVPQNTGDKNHQAPVFAPRITPCPGNNKRSPKSSSRMSKDSWLVETILINSVPHAGRQLAKHPRHPRQDFPEGVGQHSPQQPPLPTLPVCLPK